MSADKIPAHPNVHEALAAAQRDLDHGIATTGRVQGGQSYRYLSDLDLVSAVRPVWARHGLSLVPTGMGLLSDETYETARGGTMRRVLVSVDWSVVHASGTSLSICTVGEAADSGDKAAGKAMTHARKYALRLVLMATTGEDPDEHGSDTSEAAPRTPQGGSQRPGRTESPSRGQDAPSGRKGPTVAPSELAVCPQCGDPGRKYWVHDGSGRGPVARCAAEGCDAEGSTGYAWGVWSKSEAAAWLREGVLPTGRRD